MKRLPQFGSTEFFHIKQEDFDCDVSEFYTENDFPASAKDLLKNNEEVKIYYIDNDLFINDLKISVKEYVQSKALTHVIENEFLGEKGYSIYYKDVWKNRDFNKDLFDKENEFHYEDADCLKCGHLLEKTSHTFSRGVSFKGQVLKCSECHSLDYRKVKFFLKNKGKAIQEARRLEKGMMCFEPTEDNVKLFAESYGLTINLKEWEDKPCTSCEGKHPWELLLLGKRKKGTFRTHAVYRCTNCGHQISTSMADDKTPEGKVWGDTIRSLSETLGGE